MAAPAWQSDSTEAQDHLDPLPVTRRVRWQLFLVVPILLLVAGGWLLAASAAVGSALMTVFVYSFIIMTPVAIYFFGREIWSRVRSFRQ